MSVKIITEDPTIEVIAEQSIDESGVYGMAKWVESHRPDCIDGLDKEDYFQTTDLLPHDTSDRIKNSPDAPGERWLTDNEILAELAGRKCYDSFAEKAGKKTNKEYLNHIFSMDPLHSSILYHAKMTFFFAGVSRKFSHQFIRNYVGSDRNEEGSPSQESTRFTHHYGWYVAPPYIINQKDSLKRFNAVCEHNYCEYEIFIIEATTAYEKMFGKKPTGQYRKDIFEAAAGFLNMSAETSFIWTTNPMAIRKFLKERCHDAADAEIYRFSKKLAKICFERWPNLFLGDDLDGVRAEIAK